MPDVNHQSALLPQPAEVALQGRPGLLSISELLPACTARQGGRHHGEDPANPSSIVACLQAARDTVRAVRGALNTEAWKVRNQT